ncbi:hypothetical protein F5J12DRAFT_828932 [Pisolithus orientalis]|uniref:uncharacterized protein n=1 Tax=Pisolithus orientalis TaxID=936130 RepID=UPI002225589E|nr:uncharacterized protein F5J12DRAFT_828932 [Pisolithus orientalis]KAI6007560.1 hypothetical protein F5J12DRAFT_828932 [Pisolithus orientalis]
MVNDHHGVSRVVHHKDYYLRGGDMTVLVENHLYRIHSYFFDRESLFFRQKLLAGPSEDGDDRGSSDNNAYTLDDVKSEDFARFLWVFYNPLPLDVWLSILRLATRWGFNNVKELTVRELEKLEIECVDKISIYHEHNISKLYLIPSYVAILGMETVLRTADARERARQRASESGVRTPSFDDFEDSEVEIIVREVFGLGSRPTSPTPAVASPIPNGSRNGVSADTAAKTSVDNMRTFTTAMGSQVPTAQSTATIPPSTTPAPPPQTATAMPTTSATKPGASTTSTEKLVPPLPPQVAADTKDKEVLSAGNKSHVPETPKSANNPQAKSAGTGWGAGRGWF